VKDPTGGGGLVAAPLYAGRGRGLEGLGAEGVDILAVKASSRINEAARVNGEGWITAIACSVQSKSRWRQDDTPSTWARGGGGIASSSSLSATTSASLRAILDNLTTAVMTRKAERTLNDKRQDWMGD
jgi:hypothetical protein